MCVYIYIWYIHVPCIIKRCKVLPPSDRSSRRGNPPQCHLNPIRQLDAIQYHSSSVGGWASSFANFNVVFHATLTTAVRGVVVPLGRDITRSQWPDPVLSATSWTTPGKLLSRSRTPGSRGVRI